MEKQLHETQHYPLKHLEEAGDEDYPYLSYQALPSISSLYKRHFFWRLACRSYGNERAFYYPHALQENNVSRSNLNHIVCEVSETGGLDSSKSRTKDLTLSLSTTDK